FFKTTNEFAQDFEKNLLAAIIDYIPIIMSLATLFVSLYGFSVLIRSYIYTNIVSHLGSSSVMKKKNGMEKSMKRQVKRKS
ncbi:MAG TPA: hypothetical protein VK119_06185, partial [Bacillota bacterium]|nr:hypothetical protein [Bacillota bacterium]